MPPLYPHPAPMRKPGKGFPRGRGAESGPCPHVRTPGSLSSSSSVPTLSLLPLYFLPLLPLPLLGLHLPAWLPPLTLADNQPLGEAPLPSLPPLHSDGILMATFSN